VARLRSREDAAEASSVVVGMQGVSNAIEFRKSKSGSCSEVAICCCECESGPGEERLMVTGRLRR
jgi:hypothetical protein